MNITIDVGYRMDEMMEPFDYHSHQEYEIYFFHEGKCRYLIHNQIYDLEPGDIIIMDGMTLHKANVQENIDYVRSVIHFSPAWLQGALEGLDGMYLLDIFKNLGHCLIRTDENEILQELEGILKRLAKVKKGLDSKEKQIKMKTLLMQILLILQDLVKTEYAYFPKNDGDKAKHAERIATYIQMNYMHALSLDKIAEDLNVSKYYMSHLFKEVTGLTIMEYLMECRLTQVKYLLEMKPDLPLQKIALESGFVSAAHFSRYFKEKIGMTASDYRKLRLKHHLQS